MAGTVLSSPNIALILRRGPMDRSRIWLWRPQHRRRPTWFALMASLMNIALVASQLQTKYLNDIFVVGRGQYAELGPLLIWAVALSFIIPVGAIALVGKRTRGRADGDNAR
jgi:hypothetical protein